jgi:hypothetical protein
MIRLARFSTRRPFVSLAVWLAVAAALAAIGLGPRARDARRAEGGARHGVQQEINRIVEAGLALGVSYAMLVYRRRRTERGAVDTHDRAGEAIASSRAVETSGRAVLIGGTALVVTLAPAPLIGPDTILIAIAAVMTILGRRLQGILPAVVMAPWNVLANRGGGWVIRNAIGAGALATALLPKDDSARVAYDKISAGHGAGHPRARRGARSDERRVRQGHRDRGRSGRERRRVRRLHQRGKRRDLAGRHRRDRRHPAPADRAVAIGGPARCRGAFDLLTAAATFGILSLLYSGDDPLLGAPGYIDPISIIGIFAFVFGVSMVYEVVLLHRTREAFLATGDAHGAVRTGLQDTAAAATGAAAVMLAAIILDALIVRPVLLPAAASLLGRWSWWPLSRQAPPTPPPAPKTPAARPAPAGGLPAGA